MIDATLIQIPASPVDSAATTTANGATQPSTDGFLQVLELFLGSSPLPSSLLGATTIVQSASSATDGGQASIDAPTLGFSPTQGAADDGELDASTLERIASLLQTLGFQVKATDIQELSPLDMEQLSTAMEFVQRNLERGTDPSLVAENAALLLPRPWELDESNGSPQGTGAVTGSTETGLELPAGFTKELESLRSALHGRRHDAPATSESKPLDDAGTGNRTSKDQNASTATDPAAFPHSKSQDSDSPRNGRSRSDRNGSDPALWLHQMRQADPVSTDSLDTAPASTPRHLVPGGTTSELIGRQVLEKIHVQLSEGHRELKLRLWPEELGEVRMSLKMTDSEKVHANLVVENDAVRQAILDATPQLKDALSRHGLDLERMSVSVGQKDAQEAGERQDGKGRKNDARSRSRGSEWNDAQASLVGAIALGEDTGIRNGRNTIDLWS